MTPRTRTYIEYCKQLPHEWSFECVEQSHLLAGYCVSTPEYYVCARPVIKGDVRMDNPMRQFNLEQCDCWFVWMAGGDLRLLWTILPHDLQWVAFYRHGTGRVRYYDTDKLRRRSLWEAANHQHHQSQFQ